MPEGLAEEDIVSICITPNNRLGTRVGDHVRFRLNDRVHKAWPASFGLSKGIQVKTRSTKKDGKLIDQRLLGLVREEEGVYLISALRRGKKWAKRPRPRIESVCEGA